MKGVFTLALILVMGGFLHADITLPGESGGSGPGWGTLTPVVAKTRSGAIGSPLFPATYFTYDLSSWVYRDADGLLVFLWQITNNTTSTAASGVTQNANNWFGSAFEPYSTGNYGTAEQTDDSGAMITDLNNDFAGLAQAGGVDPNSPSTTAWSNVTYYNQFSDEFGYIYSNFGDRGIGIQVNALQHSTIWWVHTNATNYVNGDLNINIGVDGVSTLGGVVNIESYMPTSAVPEPATLFLMGSGFVGLAGAMRKKLRRS